MSHDQKPGKVRVVGEAPVVDNQRRGDRASAAEASLLDASAMDDLSVDSPDAAAAKTSAYLLPVIFIAGCATGGATLTLLAQL